MQSFPLFSKIPNNSLNRLYLGFLPVLLMSGHIVMRPTIISNGAGTQIVNAEEQGSIITTGNQNQILNAGKYCRVTCTGINTEVISLHDSTQASFSGSYTRFVGFGDYTRVVCNGSNSLIALHVKYGVGAAIGPHSIVKAALSNWIVLAEYYSSDSPHRIRTGLVDGIHLKADTWYKLENSKFVETVSNDY